MKPFRTISAMVNATCNLACLHCDLPRRFDSYRRDLDPLGWSDLLDRLLPAIAPEVVSVAAMEPLLPKIGQPRTEAILSAAQRHGISAGVVTNGTYAAEFFARVRGALRLDFLDLSVEGAGAANDRIRGDGHFAAVDRFLRDGGYRGVADRVLISTTINAWNAAPEPLRALLDWVRDVMPEPRIVLLLLYPNQHVQPGLTLDDSHLTGILDLLVAESRDFSDMFLEVFPQSLPGLASLVAAGVLPGAAAVERDEAGMLWGHVDDNLFVRFENRRDLARYHLRISPEGSALPPESLERQDYLEGSYGDLVTEDWASISARILAEVEPTREQLPVPCVGRPCARVCKGENSRCSILHPEAAQR